MFKYYIKGEQLRPETGDTDRQWTSSIDEGPREVINNTLYSRKDGNKRTLVVSLTTSSCRSF